MALNLTTLFTRIGHLIYTLDTSLNVYQGSTLVTRANTIAADYTTTDQDLPSNLYSQLASAQSGLSGFANYQRQLAQSVVVRMVNEDTPQANQSLNTALNAVIDAMVAGSATVKRNTVSAVVTPGGTNTGNGVVICGMTSNLGVPLEYAFAETITGVVTRDSQSGATSGKESLGFSGQFAVNDQMSWLYPAGSGASTSLTAVTATTGNGTGTSNQLSNSNFETFTTPNIPDGWHITTGVAGTSVLKSTGTFYDGAASLQFLGDGAELTTLYTSLGVDTSATVKAETTYAVNFWLKMDVAPAAGVLRVALVDGSNNVVNDVAGSANSFTVNLTSIGTTFVAANGFFRTPRVLPTATRLQFKLTTAISAGKSVFIDRVTLAQPTSLYAGGPMLAAFSGSTPWIADDSFSIAVANAFNGLVTSGCDRLFSLRTQGLALPSTSGSPTISEGLVA